MRANLGPIRIGGVGSRILPRSPILLPPQRTDGPVGVFVEFQPFLRLALPPPILLLLVLLVVVPVVGPLPVVLTAFPQPPGRDRRGPRGHRRRCVRRRDDAGRDDGARRRGPCARRARRGQSRGGTRRGNRGRRRGVGRPGLRLVPCRAAVRELVLADLDFDLVRPQATFLLPLLLPLLLLLLLLIGTVVVLHGGGLEMVMVILQVMVPLERLLLDQARGRGRGRCRRCRRRRSRRRRRRRYRCGQ